MTPEQLQQAKALIDVLKSIPEKEEKNRLEEERKKKQEREEERAKDFEEFTRLKKMFPYN